MDIGVYSIKSISNEKISSMIDQRRSFIIEDISRLHMKNTIRTLEKIIEAKRLRCRVYTMGRAATMAAAAVPIAPTVIGGWAAGIAIGVHNLATWDPDYEIGKNLATGRLEINYKK